LPIADLARWARRKLAIGNRQLEMNAYWQSAIGNERQLAIGNRQLEMNANWQLAIGNWK
jgi:hypothetical protein